MVAMVGILARWPGFAFQAADCHRKGSLKLARRVSAQPTRLPFPPLGKQ